ncbi:MAG: DUF3868 domain-containing protein [Porphyromonas sp.]|nr:DUF3868 domain-containing protein [Porphyromonas sp.]
MKKIIFSLCIMIAAASYTVAQSQYADGVRFDHLSSTMRDGHLQIRMNVLLDNLDLATNDMLIFTPILRSNTGEEKMALPAIVTTGKTRNKVFVRNKTLRNPTAIPADTHTVIARKNNTAQSVDYKASVPFSQWMQNASLDMQIVVSGCANCTGTPLDKPLIQKVIAEPYKPNYKLTYIVPEVEPVKARKDRHSASLNFMVDKSELLRNYKNNATELARVDKVITEVRGNKDINVTEFAIMGYASPEASFEYNRSLSERRAEAFVDYLVSTHGIKRAQIKSVVGHGEDWESLREALLESGIAKAKTVIGIIDGTSNPDARDAKIVAIDNGVTYKLLMDRFYPRLRRTDYVIAYNVRAFDVEEAKVIIKTNPKYLSLNEMYLVARTYPEGSKEFNEVFDIATRLFPSEPVAIVNASAVDIETGNFRVALERLLKVADRKDALNNLGVAYARMGQYDKARKCFEEAISSGDELAEHNLKELSIVEEQNM